MSTNVRIYRGLAHREHTGWIMGLTPWQALTCLVLAVPVLWTVSASHFLEALILAGICGVAA